MVVLGWHGKLYGVARGILIAESQKMEEAQQGSGGQNARRPATPTKPVRLPQKGDARPAWMQSMRSA